MYASLKTFPVDANITAVYDIDYQEAKDRREDLRSANVTQVNLADHQIITTDDEAHEDIFVGCAKPWDAITDVFFSGTPHQDTGRAYARCTAVEDGLTFTWAVRFEFCQSHGHLLLDVLPDAARKALIEKMRDVAEGQDIYASRLEAQARAAREQGYNVRRLYRQD